MKQFVNNTIAVIPRIFVTKILGESRMLMACCDYWIALELLRNSGNDEIGFGVCEGSVG